MDLSLLQQFFSVPSGSPHGYCLLWQSELVYLHAISNILIFLAYVAIPITIYIYIRNKPRLISKHLFWLFAAFILACALTHLMGAIVIWKPYYLLQGIIMAFTALTSVVTAIVLVQQVPVLLSLPTTAELQELNQELQKQITLRVAAEEELLHLNKTLEQRIANEVDDNRQKDLMLIHQSRLASMGEMIGNIAHQWRQPLNALSIVLMNISDAHEYKELTTDYLDKQIRDGEQFIQNMSSTIDDFRDFFKSSESAAVFNVSNCIKDALNIIETSFKNNNITIQKDLDETLCINGFKGQYQQVILNILGNAKNAILENSISSGTIHLTLSQKNKRAVVTIQDNAGGISPDIIKDIFNPYFTTRTEGTGLGLYMSKMIIEKNMQGTISCNNKEQGAYFYVETLLEA